MDGDSLAKLAGRYLDDPRRSEEIFTLNRGVLSDPELLPIGAELKIPPRTAPIRNREPVAHTSQRGRCHDLCRSSPPRHTGLAPRAMPLSPRCRVRAVARQASSVKYARRQDA